MKLKRIIILTVIFILIVLTATSLAACDGVITGETVYKSAYDLAVEKGYNGSEDEWLSSLAGKDGKSAYELAVENGYEGTLSEWLESLEGEVCVKKIEINDNGELIVTYTDDTVVNVGKIADKNHSAETEHETNCNATDTEHTWVYAYTLEKANCQAGGQDLYACESCNLVSLVKTPIDDHIPGEWIVDTKPTGKKEGLKHTECTICGTICATESIPKLEGQDLKLGMGVVVSFASSSTGNAQTDVTFASVVTDDEGVILSCRVDVLQCRTSIYDDGSFTFGKFETKVEIGDDYGLAKLGQSFDWNGDGKVLEWYKQAEAFENWAVGKTAAEIASMELQTNTSGYILAVDEDLLSAGCTISVSEIRDAVVKACNDDQAVEFSTAANLTHGIATHSYDNSSTNASDGNDGRIDVWTVIATSVLDEDGKVCAALVDRIQPKIDFNTAGEIISTSYNGTNRELKENYNMAKYGASMDWNKDGKVLEWYIQSEAFSKHVVGMTAADVEAMSTQVVEGAGYVISADDALLSAGCTIQITEFKVAMHKAIRYAK